MSGNTVQLDSKTLWGGKESPFQTSYGKLMMWFFLVSDALTFSGLLVAYGFVRHDTLEAWPIGEETFNSLPFLGCLLYTSPSPRDATLSRMPSSA